MECAILSGHRRIKPFGLEGGEAGELGQTLVKRLDGSVDILKGADQTALKAGETITVITPTGGGYGPKEKRLAV
jgi:5-oxoprolinase (ATP-hydrolysing)